MTKIAYNTCYGGFSLSEAAIERYAQLKGWTLTWENSDFSFTGHIPRIAENPNFYPRNISRADPVLIQVIEELGPKANGSFAQLAIRDLPSGNRYRIDEYDGSEQVITLDEHDWNIA